MIGSSSHRLKAAKRALRRQVLARRDRVAASRRATASEAVAGRAAALPELRAARTVMAFWSFGSEVDTGPLRARLHAAGVRVALPRIEDGEVVPVAFEAGEELRPTSFGGMEPATGRALPPEAVDVVLTPGVAFDRTGNRLGYGGGYYDRLLRRTPAARIAIAFALQVIEAVPAARTDTRVDAIVTELEVIRCRNG